MNIFPENQIEPVAVEEPSIDFKQLTHNYVSKWPWYIISTLFFLFLSFLYIKYSTPMYKISARVLINDEKKGGGAAGADVLGDLGGLLGGKSTVDNEAEILKTRYLMGKVVQDMKLNTTYYKEDALKSIELYRTPFNIEPVHLLDELKGTKSFITFLGQNKISLKSEDLDTIINFNKTILLPGVGYIQVVRNPKVEILDSKYSFNVVSVKNKVSQLMTDLTVSVSSKLVTIIDLSFNYPVPKKGEDILDRLIYNYVQGNLSDKNQVADSTIAFIKRRLMIIGSELGDAEGNIQGFKQKNNLADMTEQGKLLVATTGQYVSDLAKVETQISITNSLLDYLKDDASNRRVLPSSLMPADLVYSSAIEKYNTLLLERGRKLIGLTASNPIILNIDKEIANSRADIEANLTSSLDALLITRRKLNTQMAGAEGQIKQVPATERNYLKLARQQQIKQELYLFLMQKSEETAISKTANISNSKVIDPPESEVVPYSPKRKNFYLIALVFGLVIPTLIIFVKDFLNDKIESKGDIIKLTDVSIIGEISRSVDINNLVVADNSRSAISEQFRALRTNLSFYLKPKEEKVILLTSSMSGEGKSFVAINLASILALSGNKVLLMELDLRKPGISSKLDIENNIGFTNYIISQDIKAKDIIKSITLHENVSLISSGPIPPNPAETLLDLRTNILFDELKLMFDYIIIDAPPVGLVTDAQLLAPYADLCLYLVRQEYTKKDQINIVQDLLLTKRMKKIGIVVNDIDTSSNYGYGYGYGYGGYGNYGGEDGTQSAKWKFWK